MADIFLSYAREDRVYAELLSRALRNEGWAVWWGQMSSSPQRSVKEVIDAELQHARCVIALWSRSSVRSEFVRAEVDASRDRASLLSVLVETVPLPDRESSPFFDFRAWSGDPHAPEFQQLLAAIRERLSPTHAVQQKPLAAHHRQNKALFLCYRRDDSQDAAGRLYDRLTATFGADRVFMDIDSVPLGIDFVDHVTEQIAKCSAVIVMIGKQWLTIKDKKHRRRLDSEDDLVRAEIRAALQQQVPVIPVTVQNASMPHADDLPEDIRLLARRNGIELSATRWTTDVERLIKEMDRVMKG